MILSLVTDEVSADLETALELGTAWGVHHFELRGYGDRRVPFFSDYQKQRVRELLPAHQAQVIALSPGLFKFPYPARERESFPVSVIDADLYGRWQTARDLLRQHTEEMLPASLEYARELGADRIVIFCFHRGGQPPGNPPDEVLQALHAAAEQAGRAGIRLCVEVEEGFWGDTGRRTANVIRAVNHPNLGVNWDPGNAIVAGDVPFPDGYQAVRGSTWHVHFKDVARAAGGYQYVVDGEIDWRGQIAALAADGYSGYISVETHMSPKVSAAEAGVRRLRQLIETASQ